MKSKFMKNFIAGIGSVLSIYPAFPKNPMDRQTDNERLYSDWEKVGNDIRWVIQQQVDDEQRKK